jgi:hypothetical protein
MEDASVVSGLAKRRATLSGQIAHMQEQLKQMLLDLNTLDAAIRLFDADYPIETLKPKAFRPDSHWKTRGELIRLIFSVLRQSPTPLSARDIALQIMTYKQMDTNSVKAVLLMRRRVGFALRKKRLSGHLRSHQAFGQPLVWELAVPIKPQPAANSPSTVC